MISCLLSSEETLSLLWVAHFSGLMSNSKSKWKFGGELWSKMKNDWRWELETDLSEHDHRIYKVKHILAATLCVLCNYELQSLKGKWLCASTKCLWQMWWYKCPPGRDGRSRIWLVKRAVCRQWDVYRCVCCWCSKWVDGCCCLQISMSYEGLCSWDKATSAAFLGNSMLSKWTYVFPWERIS